MAAIETRKILLSMFADSDLARIHDYSTRILGENGIRFSGERALNIFKRHGFKVDGERVCFTEGQVRSALETTPSHFVIHGLNPDRALDLGGGDYGVCGPIGPVNVLDLDGGRRQGTLGDVINLIKIYQASPVINMNSNNGVEANDVLVTSRHLLITQGLLRHTDKPFYGRLFGYRETHQVMDMIGLVAGKKLEPGGPVYFSSGSCPSMSPLAWSGDVSDSVIALSERGQAVTLGTATSTGVTGPIRIFGTLVCQNAELLSGLVLSQLVNPGNPVGYGSGATPGNMRGANYCCGSPGRVALQIGSIEMGKRFYNLPTRTLAYGSDSTGLDVQAGIESYENAMANTLAGADYMLSEIGTLEGLMTTSYEKTILDEEITSRLIHIRNGIDVSDEAASLEIILKVGCGGEFITSRDTLKNMKNDWYPKYTDWNASPSVRPPDDLAYVLRRANAEWKKRLREAPQSMLDAAQDKALDDFVKRNL
ncbi:MAG: trimethylamine methyltransferase family protein [Deltaproteobacteria bacterium]|jgi:trimethylamine--corrinoid protein Co-methyltransferase|nr:trimethylamine methyltransferase family protein [Deltaproteobacteria bacterium]